ncbi:MAG TPA: hypothetical protein VGM23_02085, partial [Armatimonadota bacterium]
MRYLLLLLIAVLGAAGWADEITTWQPAVATQTVENGTIWQHALEQANTEILAAQPISGNRPGRYRLTCNVRTQKALPCQLVLKAWEGTDVSLPIASTPIGVAESTDPTQWHTVSLTFDVKTGIPVILGFIYQGGKPAPCGWVQIEKASLRLEAIGLPLSIAWARVGKIRYQHNERGTIDVYLTNTSAKKRTVRLCPEITTYDGDAYSDEGIRCAIPGRSTIRTTVPFVLPRRDGGFAAGVTLLDGNTFLDRRDADVFCVSDSPFQFANYTYGGYLPKVGPGAYPLGLKGMQQEVLDKWDDYAKQCRIAVELFRRSYGTAHEFFAWAREDALYLAEDSDQPYLAGQCSWPETRKQFILLNRLFKEQGIAPTAYVNSVVFGWPGLTCLRERPEWFVPHSGIYSTQGFESYQKGEQPRDVCCVPTVYDKPSPLDGKTFLDWHIEQLIASAKQYGWEAFRYDAGPLPRQYFPRVEQALAKQQPRVYVGNNMAGIYTMDPETVAMRKAYCLDGSMMMDEPIGFAWHNASNPYRKWVDWMAGIRLSSHLVRSNGGHFTFINLYGNWYANIIGYACGGHPYHYAYYNPYGNAERFMILYGYYFWDLRTAKYENPETVLAVSSQRPVWWKPLVSQRSLEKGRRQIIVPLLNPPTGKEVVDTTITQRADGVTVSFKPEPGEQVETWLLTPEPTARRERLAAIIRSDGRVEVTVPSFWAWMNVV